MAQRLLGGTAPGTLPMSHKPSVFNPFERQLIAELGTILELAEQGLYRANQALALEQIKTRVMRLERRAFGEEENRKKAGLISILRAESLA